MTSQETRDKVLVWHKRGYSATETARQLGLPLEEVRAIIREGDGRPKPPRKVEFIRARSNSSNLHCSSNDPQYQIKRNPPPK